MKRNVSVVRFKFGYNILISGKIIKEMPGSVASGIPCINFKFGYNIFISGKIIKEMPGSVVIWTPCIILCSVCLFKSAEFNRKYHFEILDVSCNFLTADGISNSLKICPQ